MKKKIFYSIGIGVFAYLLWATFGQGGPILEWYIDNNETSETEYTEPSIVTESDKRNYYESFLNRIYLGNYNSYGYQYESYELDYQTGQKTYNKETPIYIFEESIFTEKERYTTFNYWRTSDVAKNIIEQMSNCRDKGKYMCDIVLNK